jgi:CheY-like chemotaxis protein
VKRVLVVDDEPALRGAFAEILEDAGYAVLTAADGQAALERAETEKPDLVLMDVMMPGLDGQRTSQAIRARADLPQPAIVLMSAAPTRVRIDPSVNGFLPKPFDLDDLLDLVARLIGLPE